MLSLEGDKPVGQYHHAPL